METKLYIDGACVGNPGPGGWAAIVIVDDKKIELFGGEKLTTNNRMELTAAIEALRATRETCVIELTTDSQYVRLGITQWLPQWKKNRWRNSQKKPVKNIDLWQALDEEVQRHQVSWHWVKGHSGHPENEMADQLANEAIDELSDNE